VNLTFKRQPVLWVNVIKLGLLAGGKFGLKITDDQLLGLIVFLEAAGGLIVHSNVYAPVNKEGMPIIVVHPEPDFREPTDDPPFVEQEERRASPRRSTEKKSPDQLLKDYLDGSHGMKPP